MENADGIAQWNASGSRKKSIVAAASRVGQLGVNATANGLMRGRVPEQFYYCTNRDCGKAAACDEVECGLEWRVCDCGSLMKKEAHTTVFAYLDFLWGETCSETADTNEKEETPCEN